MNPVLSQHCAALWVVGAIALALGAPSPARAQAPNLRLVSLECVRPLERDGDELALVVLSGPMLVSAGQVAPLRPGEVRPLNRNLIAGGPAAFRLVRLVPGGAPQLINQVRLKIQGGVQTVDIKWKGAHYRLQYEWLR